MTWDPSSLRSWSNWSSGDKWGSGGGGGAKDNKWGGDGGGDSWSKKPRGNDSWSSNKGKPRARVDGNDGGYAVKDDPSAAEAKSKLEGAKYILQALENRHRTEEEK